MKIFCILKKRRIAGEKFFFQDMPLVILVEEIEVTGVDTGFWERGPLSVEVHTTPEGQMRWGPTEKNLDFRAQSCTPMLLFEAGFSQSKFTYKPNS